MDLSVIQETLEGTITQGSGLQELERCELLHHIGCLVFVGVMMQILSVLESQF